MLPIIGDYYENRLEESWDACKNEVLKILNDTEFKCPARKDLIDYLRSEIKKL